METTTLYTTVVTFDKGKGKSFSIVKLLHQILVANKVNVLPWPLLSLI